MGVTAVMEDSTTALNVLIALGDLVGVLQAVFKQQYNPAPNP
jgi:hypothetical protein